MSQNAEILPKPLSQLDAKIEPMPFARRLDILLALSSWRFVPESAQIAHRKREPKAHCTQKLDKKKVPCQNCRKEPCRACALYTCPWSDPVVPSCLKVSTYN